MGTGQSVSDVLRTLIIWGTVALLGYFGFILLRGQLQSLPSQVGTIPGGELKELRAELRDIKDEIAGLSKCLSDDKQGPGELTEQSFSIYMLVARYEGDQVHVYGRLKCLRGTWHSVELSFVFRGHNDIKLYRYQHKLPSVSETSPMDAGMKLKFDFIIPKFHDNFLEDNATATVVAKPLRDP